MEEMGMKRGIREERQREREKEKKERKGKTGRKSREQDKWRKRGPKEE